MKLFRKNLKGYSLAELVLAIGIFAVISSMLVLLVVDATKTLDNTRTRARASNLTQEINTALIMLKNQSWYNIAKHTDDGIKYLDFVDNQYQILDGQGVRGELTYSFTIIRALRENGNIVLTGGNPDSHTRVISITITWKDRLGREHSITPSLYLNDWNTHSFVDSTKEDFDSGEYSLDTIWHTDLLGVSLQEMSYGDWCNPSFQGSQHNITGSATAGNIWADQDHAFLGTGGNASGVAFWKVAVTGEPPVFLEEGTLEKSYKTNDVFGVGNYALIATDVNRKEIIILDISSTPYQEIGYVNPPENWSGSSVFALNNNGFFTYTHQTGNKLAIFDLSSFAGNRPLKASFILDNPVSDIFVDDNYIYLTLENTNNDNTVYDFVIYSYTDSSISFVSGINLGPTRAKGLYISSEQEEKMDDSTINTNNTRAYVVTELNSSGSEFFIIDISDKSTPSIISTFDTNLAQNMNPKAVAVAAKDRRAIIAGGGTNEVYTVLDIENELSPSRCGGVPINNYDVNALALVRKETSPYTYLVTNDSSYEFKIIKGGPGGGGANGMGYIPYGIYTSQIFDSNSDSSEYYILSISAEIPTGTSLKVQIRISNISTMTGSSFVGPDGTENTYFDSSSVFDLPQGLIGRYVQYKIIMESDSNKEFSPLIKEIAINYEK